MNSNKGKIELIIGPMFSSKSTTLLARLRRYEAAKKKCIGINHSLDSKRYTDDYGGGIRTHDNDRHSDSYSRTNLYQTKEEEYSIGNIYKDVDVIIIDEGHWFSDIVSFCEEMANKGKIIIVAALSGTFERKPFNDILYLCSIAEKITHLTAICTICGKTAHFTKRIGDSKEINLPGGEDGYMACCRSCYLKDNDVMVTDSTEKISKKEDIDEYEAIKEDVHISDEIVRNEDGIPIVTYKVPSNKVKVIFSVKKENKIIPSLKRTLSSLSIDCDDELGYDDGKKHKFEDIGRKDIEISI